jgi:hypothetical protein
MCESAVIQILSDLLPHETRELPVHPGAVESVLTSLTYKIFYIDNEPYFIAEEDDGRVFLTPVDCGGE